MILLKLIQRHLSAAARVYIHEAEHDSIRVMNKNKLDYLLLACRKADDIRTAFKTCEYLMILNYKEAVSCLCSRWISGTIFSHKDNKNKILQKLAEHLFTALQAGYLKKVIPTDTDLVIPLLSVCAEPDPELSTNARKILKQILKMPEARNLICCHYLDHDNRIALEIVLSESCIPSDLPSKALWHFLTGQ